MVQIPVPLLKWHNQSVGAQCLRLSSPYCVHVNCMFLIFYNKMLKQKQFLHI